MKRSLTELEDLARLTRRDLLEMIYLAGSGHPGGSCSVVEILVALFGEVMKHDPMNPTWSQRDHFILSKGHACPTLYAIMARLGYFPVEELKTLRKIGARLQAHPDSKRLPGIEVSTGSLGQGLSVGVGMALYEKMEHHPNRTFVVLGDGECDEGQVWEAALSAAHYKLNNLTAIVDWNKVQLDGPTSEVMNLGDLPAKWAAFGWHVRTIDGHNLEELINVLSLPSEGNKPLAVIANTIKGKGVSFMEGKAEWHGKAPNAEQLKRALAELN
jgi:transketolase